jgi:hypothetical protein
LDFLPFLRHSAPHPKSLGLPGFLCQGTLQLLESFGAIPKALSLGQKFLFTGLELHNEIVPLRPPLTQ